MRKNLSLYRVNLKKFRVELDLTQSEMAEAVGGITKQGYGSIENGRTHGSPEFWEALQKAFNIPDSDMYNLMILKERKAKHEKPKKSHN